jgi:F420-non-reducing hydrogenase iron-sulfur subunit
MRTDAPRVLVLATDACAYAAADYVGQTHATYPSNVCIMRVPAPVIFPEEFYLGSFAKGIDGIIIMACGHECPYAGAYDRLAKRVSAVHARMKAAGMAIQRLRLCSICTVCARPFLKEVNEMNDYLRQQAEAPPRSAG